MIIGETAGLEDDGTQLGDAAATGVVEVHEWEGRAGASHPAGARSPGPSAGDACGSDAEVRQQGIGRRFRPHNDRASSGRRRQNARASGQVTRPLVRFSLPALVWRSDAATNARYHVPPHRAASSRRAARRRYCRVTGSISDGSLSLRASPPVENDAESGQFGASGGAESGLQRAASCLATSNFNQIHCNLRRPTRTPIFRKVPRKKPGTLRSQHWFDNPAKPRL